MKKYENLAKMMMDAVENPGKYPEVKPGEKIPESPKPTESEHPDWIKRLEKKHDDGPVIESPQD